ncbi:MAG: cytochrome c [Geminicoccaceae bacterium]
MVERAVLLLALLPVAVTAEPRTDRQGELLHLLRQDCGACHGMTLKGGLGPPLLPTSLGEREPEDLARIILHGVPGTPMPPWGFEIGPEEAMWLARQLKRGVPR